MVQWTEVESHIEIRGGSSPVAGITFLTSSQPVHELLRLTLSGL
jgi:hypothetical protein